MKVPGSRCDDHDRLLLLLGPNSEEAWPKSHLSTETIQRIENAITRNLVPVRPLPSTPRFAARMIAINALVGIVASLLVGTAGLQAPEARRSIEVLGILAAGIPTLTLTLSSHMAPGARVLAYSRFASFAPLLGIALLVLFSFPYQENEQFLSIGLQCLKIGSLSSLPALALTALHLRRGFSTMRILQGCRVGVLAGSIGLTVLEVSCPYINRLHVLVWHLGSAALITAIGTACSAFFSSPRRLRV